MKSKLLFISFFYIGLYASRLSVATSDEQLKTYFTDTRDISESIANARYTCLIQQS